MHTTYAMDTCIETNVNRVFASLWHGGIFQVYIYIPDICKRLEYIRHMPDTCLTYDTIRIPDVRARLLLESTRITSIQVGPEGSGHGQRLWANGE